MNALCFWGSLAKFYSTPIAIASYVWLWPCKKKFTVASYNVLMGMVPVHSSRNCHSWIAVWRRRWGSAHQLWPWWEWQRLHRWTTIKVCNSMATCIYIMYGWIARVFYSPFLPFVPLRLWKTSQSHLATRSVCLPLLTRDSRKCGRSQRRLTQTGI